ncbi:hypothetical protein CNMCM8927_001891 [Aspergillus lentulus]|uniref:GLEYA adhesin domain-containing protein n=1 Tax=Aspergillus lentulus TaxID=293939 RepID=A0AAN5YIF7_ASPLE|nr:hypothetical protein CNMCM6069_003178 [Aspergillus lentulus]KAF4179561.1 hypothetical protein CNMCM7927_001810 [Aspergillus lentulus]KAF4201243.1 hypothetical protein CNMCM8927_001891 [Aspergillus lentulus]
MLSSILSILAVVVSAAASSSDCSCLAGAASALGTEPLASAFCSQLVPISTVVVSTTVTTPAAITTSTKTVPAPFTDTTTLVDISSRVSTKTVTQTSPSVQCYAGTTFGSQPTPTPLGPDLEKRQLPTISLPTISVPTIPVPTLPIPTPTWVPPLEASLLSSACECFLGPSRTVTHTTTKWVASGTYTATVEVTTVPTTTTHVTLVIVSTDVVVTAVPTATSTVTTTTTSYTPVPTNTQLGLNWYYYYSSQNYFPGHAITFDPQSFNSPKYNFSGYVQNVGSFGTVNYPSTDHTCNPPVNAPWANTDNAFYAWHGTKAYSDYQKNNYDYLTGDYIKKAGSVTVHVGVGELVPFTFIWANGGGPGQAYLAITDPAGKAHADTTGFFVPANSTCPGYKDPFSP